MPKGESSSCQFRGSECGRAHLAAAPTCTFFYWNAQKGDIQFAPAICLSC